MIPDHTHANPPTAARLTTPNDALDAFNVIDAATLYAFNGLSSIPCGPAAFDAIRRGCEQIPPFDGPPLFGHIPIRVVSYLPPNAMLFVDKDGKVLGSMGLSRDAEEAR